MYGHSGGMFFGGGVLMWILWVVLVVVVLYVIKLIVGSINRDSSSSSNEALEILKQRYAKGEIDEAEYERRKKQIQ